MHILVELVWNLEAITSKFVNCTTKLNVLHCFSLQMCAFEHDLHSSPTENLWDNFKTCGCFECQKMK